MSVGVKYVSNDLHSYVAAEAFSLVMVVEAEHPIGVGGEGCVGVVKRCLNESE